MFDKVWKVDLTLECEVLPALEDLAASDPVEALAARPNAAASAATVVASEADSADRRRAVVSDHHQEAAAFQEDHRGSEDHPGVSEVHQDLEDHQGRRMDHLVREKMAPLERAHQELRGDQPTDLEDQEDLADQEDLVDFLLVPEGLVHEVQEDPLGRQE